MFTERTEGFAGVAGVFYTPGMFEKGCLTVVEQRSSRTTNKIAGSQTVPKESALPGESELDTLLRLGVEEVHTTNVSMADVIPYARKIAVCELNVGLLVPFYSIPLSSDAEVVIGSESEEVCNLRWTPYEWLLNEPAYSLRVRPGTFEGVKSHLAFLEDPLTYIPRVYRFDQLKHKIPIAVFDLVEDGFNVRVALSRLGLLWRILQLVPEYQPSDRLPILSGIS